MHKLRNTHITFQVNKRERVRRGDVIIKEKGTKIVMFKK